MCMTIPGEIIAIEDNTATLKVLDKTITAHLLNRDFSIGDFVFVRNNIAEEKISRKQAQECLKLFQELI